MKGVKRVLVINHTNALHVHIHYIYLKTPVLSVQNVSLKDIIFKAIRNAINAMKLVVNALVRGKMNVKIVQLIISFIIIVATQNKNA